MKLIKKFLPLVSTLTLLGVFVSSAGWLSKRLVVSQVECYTQFGPCPEEYYSPLEHIQGKPMLSFLPRQELTEAYKNYLQVESVELYRRLPNTVVASVRLRKPVGVVGSAVLGMVDEQGLVFGETKDSSLPQLVYKQDLNLGDRLSAEYIASLEILGKVYSITGQKSQGELKETILTISLASGTKIIVDIDRDYQEWAKTLQAIFGRSKIEGKHISKIDLRYLNPVVVY